MKTRACSQVVWKSVIFFCASLISSVAVASVLCQANSSVHTAYFPHLYLSLPRFWDIMIINQKLLQTTFCHSNKLSITQSNKNIGKTCYIWVSWKVLILKTKIICMAVIASAYWETAVFVIYLNWPWKTAYSLLQLCVNSLHLKVTLHEWKWKSAVNSLSLFDFTFKNVTMFITFDSVRCKTNV